MKNFVHLTKGWESYIADITNAGDGAIQSTLISKDALTKSYRQL